MPQVSPPARRLVFPLLLAFGIYPTSAAALDCNTNGVPDEIDISQGTSVDCNTNAVPDECDIIAGSQGLFGVSAQTVALFAVDPITGIRSTVGIMDQGVTRGLGLAAHPVTRELFAVLSTTVLTGHRFLGRVHRDTAAVTHVGPLATARLADIAFHSDGRLFGVMDVRGGGAGGPGGSILQINTVNAAVLQVGVNAGFGPVQTIATQPNTDFLFHTFSNHLERINLNNFQRSLVNLSLLPDGFAPAMTFHPVSGHLFGASRSGLNGQFFERNLDTWDLRIFGPEGTSMNGMAFALGLQDCNANGAPDECDIVSGFSLDCNDDGQSDECAFPGCTGLLRGDLNDCDGLVDGRDIPFFISRLISGRYTCQADMNEDGLLTLADIAGFADTLTAP